MRTIYRFACTIFVALGTISLPAACSGGGSHEGHAHEEDTALHGGEEEKEHHHDEALEDAGKNGSLIELDDERAGRFGVQTQVAAPAPFASVLKVSGQLAGSPSDISTASSPIAGEITYSKGIAPGSMVNKGQTIARVSAQRMQAAGASREAEAALKSAQREVERIRPLHTQGIVSTKDFNAALAVLESARAAVSAQKAQVTAAVIAPTSGTITSLEATNGSIVEPGTPVAAINSGKGTSLRADLPESRYQFLKEIQSAKIRPSYSDEVIDLAKLHISRGGGSKGSAAVAQGGVIPVWFTCDNSPDLIPGAYCEVYLLGAERPHVISVPIEAVSEQQGRHFVYAKAAPGHYTKIPVTLGESDGERYEIISGLKGDEDVVNAGTQFVRLAETSKVAIPGHTHNH